MSASERLRALDGDESPNAPFAFYVKVLPLIPLIAAVVEAAEILPEPLPHEDAPYILADADELRATHAALTRLREHLEGGDVAKPPPSDPRLEHWQTRTGSHGHLEGGDE